MIAAEELAFSSMLARGIKELDARAATLRASGATTLDGETAFFLCAAGPQSRAREAGTKRTPYRAGTTRWASRST